MAEKHGAEGDGYPDGAAVPIKAASSDSLEVKIKGLKLQLAREKLQETNASDDSSETLMHQLLKDAKQQDQLVQSLRIEAEERDLKVAKLKEEIRQQQQSCILPWDVNDIADTCWDAVVASIDPDDVQYHGMRVLDLMELRNDILANMNDYCQVHQQNTADLSHICQESPCRFTHFHIPHGIPASARDGKRQQDLSANMHLVVERYIRTCVCGAKRWVDVLNKIKGRPALKVTTFVSHSWYEPFAEFVDTLADALDPMETVFVGAFAMDLSSKAKEALAVDVCNSTFVKALQCSLQVLVVVDSQMKMANRLWCDAELLIARSLRKPIILWPHSSWNGNFKMMQAGIRKLDVSQSVASNNDDEEKLKNFITSRGGGYQKVTTFIQALMLDRVTTLAKSCHQAFVEFGSAPGSDWVGMRGQVMKARVQQMQTRLEMENVRQIAVADLLHGDCEFVDVTGPFFPQSDAVEPLYDSSLNCLVSRLRGSKGLNRLKCTAALELGFGTWTLGFIMRRVLPVEGCSLRQKYYFHEDIALSLNGSVEKCTTLTDELGTEESDWQMLRVGDVTIPSPGLGVLTRDSYTGTFSHKAFQKGRVIEVSATLLWNLGRKELLEGTWTFNAKTYPIQFQEDGLWVSLIDAANNLILNGKFIDTDGNDVVLKGGVVRSTVTSGEFQLTRREEQLRCAVEVMLTGNENCAQQEGMMYSSNAFSKKGGGFSLPKLQVSPQVASSYQSKPTCMSNNCECKSRPISEYGLFVDRCYAFRQSVWLPDTGDAFNQGLVRAEPSFRVV